MRATVTASEIFSTRGRVDVLRVLWGVELPMTAAEVARRTQLSHPAASTILGTLAEYGLVASAPAGRGNVFWLSRSNLYVEKMVEPIFSAELDLPEMLIDSLRAHFEDDTVSLVLFGSYARGDQTPRSDIDVIAVSDDAIARSRIENDLGSKNLEFRRMFGASLSVIVYTLNEAIELAQRAPELYQSLLDDGIRISGASVEEWKNHATE
jgi:predicted nucleotidyltransferase